MMILSTNNNITNNNMLMFSLLAFFCALSCVPKEVTAFVPQRSIQHFGITKKSVFVSISSSPKSILSSTPTSTSSSKSSASSVSSASSRLTKPLHQLQMTTGTNSTITMGDGKKPGIQLRASPLKKKMPQDDEGGPVQPIRSIDAFVDAIENAPKDSLVIVKFHAKWCKVCARVTVKMRQMAQRLAKKGTPVPLSFISVEISANNEICSTLGIKKFPFVHMYRNKECVAAFGTGPAHNFQKVVGGTLDEKMSMTDDQWEEFRMEFKNEIGEGLEKFEALKLSTFFDGDDVSSDDSGSGSDSGVSP